MWTVTSSRELEAIEELGSNPSDRAIGIVVASFVEAHLTDLIKRLFIKESAESSKETVEQKMFHSSAPLGAFASKIRLAYLMGLISQECFKNLETMKEIRNRFAHYPAIGSFNIPEVSDRCKNLTLVEKYIVDTPNGVHGDPTSIFAMEVRGAADKFKNPKDRYVLAAEVLCIGLQQGAPELTPRTPAF